MNHKLKTLLWANHVGCIGFGMLGPLYALFVEEIGGNIFHAGASWAVFTFASGIFIILSGRYSDAHHKLIKRLIVYGYLIMALVGFGYLLVDTLWHLYLIQFVLAVGSGIVNPNMKVVFARMEDQGSEASEWGYLEGGNFFVLGIASLSAGLIVQEFGFESIFVIMGLTMLGSAYLSQVAIAVE